MKKIFILNTLAFFIFVACGTAYASSYKVFVNDRQISFDVPPKNLNNHLVVPLRKIFEELGASVQWYGREQMVTAFRNNATVTLFVGKKHAYKNSQAINISTPPVTIKNRVMVPLRFVSESLGAQVEYVSSSNSVYIYLDNRGATNASLGSGDIKEVAKNSKYVIMIKTYDHNRKALGSGSGVIIGKNGIIVTNYHVIQGAGHAEVLDNAGSTYPVQGFVAFDKNKDLALIKIGTDLPHCPIGDSDFVEVGDKVIAIGSPLGLKNTVSDGIISNLHQIGDLKLLQTTAPISQGSSGGGLFNMKGQLVGITFAYFTEGQSLNLAIPAKHVSSLLNNAGSHVAPLSLPSLPEWSKSVSVEELVGFLNKSCGNYTSGSRRFRFTYEQGAGQNFDYSLFATIEPDDYINWLSITSEERSVLIENIIDEISAKIPGNTFSIIFFYQEYWDKYPLEFDPDDISLSPDGRQWLVTHVIAVAHTDDGNIKWKVIP